MTILKVFFKYSVQTTSEGRWLSVISAWVGFGLFYSSSVLFFHSHESGRNVYDQGLNNYLLDYLGVIRLSL